MTGGWPNTRILEIVDTTAQMAAEISGVKAAYGVGSQLVDDPLHPGQKITEAGPNVLEAGTHWSDLPTFGNLPMGAMQGEFIVTWKLPMKYFVDGGDQGEIRRAIAPMYRLYLAKFASSITLRKTCRRWSNLTWGLGRDADATNAWLDMVLTVEERLNLQTEA